MSERGNTFVEYFVLATIAALATIWFYDEGNFRGVRRNVEQAFQQVSRQVAR